MTSPVGSSHSDSDANQLLLPRFFTDLYRYRGYLLASAVRNIRVRYRNSFLGYLWSILNPLLMMLVLVVVFSHIVRLGVKDYAVFLLSALLPWHFFNSTVMQSMTSMRRAVPIIKKLRVPKQVFVVDIMLSNFVIYVFALLSLVAIMLLLGRPVTWAVALFPLHVLPLVLITTAVALLCSIACLFFDDVNHLADVALRALYFLTPILYGTEHLPEWVANWIVLNPLFNVFEALRSLFYGGAMPPTQMLIGNLALGALMLAFAAWVFARVEKKVIYVI